MLTSLLFGIYLARNSCSTVGQSMSLVIPEMISVRWEIDDDYFFKITSPVSRNMMTIHRLGQQPVTKGIETKA